MDKQMLKAYIKVLVEEEVKRVLPSLLAEAVAEVKQLSENKTQPAKPKIDRGRLAELMGISYDGETISANTKTMGGPNLIHPTQAENVDPAVVDVINRDYSQLMKKLNLG